MLQFCFGDDKRTVPDLLEFARDYVAKLDDEWDATDDKGDGGEDWGNIEETDAGVYLVAVFLLDAQQL